MTTRTGMDCSRRRYSLHRDYSGSRQRKLVLTGQMGDVMQESAKAGVSYIRSVSRKLKIDEDFYKKYDFAYTHS